MTTDYVEGATLAELARGGALPPDEAVRIVQAVLEGLEEAHALGIVHRGITAEHIIIAAGGSVKLGGFDVAKASTDANLTKVGAMIGDPRYLSPEQILGKAGLDARADLYSVGVVLYLALTGALPFDGQSDIDVLSAHVRSEPRPPRDLDPRIPAEIEAVVLRALRKSPEERFGSAQGLRQALAGQDARPHTAPPIAPAPSPEPPVEPSAPRSLRAPLAVASVLAAAAAIVGWIVLR
jgi:serine/threonine-protein kinase